MSHLRADMKMGFYPAPPVAIELFVRHLRAPIDKPASIFEPCAGEGMAVAQIASALGIGLEAVCAVELDETRAVKLHGNLPGARVLAPCSVFGTTISASSFSLVYLNCPFATELGSGYLRVEAQFLDTATRVLMPKGILAFVCPRHVIDQSDVTKILLSHYERIAILVWPDHVRNFQEVTVLAVKRIKAIDWNSITRYEAFVPEVYVQSGSFAPYQLPASRGPKRFEKSDLTEPEYIAAMNGSQVMRHLRPLPEPPLPRPPMSLGTGHLALLLSAGHLDGLVCPDDEPPHVVRGTARKTKYLVSEDVERNSKSVTTKQVYSERISLAVRVLTSDGQIQTFGDLESEDADVTEAVEEPDEMEEPELEESMTVS